MAFFGRDTVLADLRMHRQQAGLVTTGTLNRRGTTSVAYENVCLWPGDESTALGVGGNPSVSGQLTAWRVGEADEPRADDTWTVGGVTVTVLSVGKRHNHDEASGFAIYDCRWVRGT
jgi:hypothetical protein